MFYNLEIKSTYDFVFRAPAILGASIRAGTVMGLSDYESVQNQADLVSIHNAIYSYLDVGTPKNVADLSFIKVKTQSGEIRVFAADWLAQEPVKIIARKVRADINNVSPTDIEVIKNLLIQNGFSDIELSFLD